MSNLVNSWYRSYIWKEAPLIVLIYCDALKYFWGELSKAHFDLSFKARVWLPHTVSDDCGRMFFWTLFVKACPIDWQVIQFGVDCDHDECTCRDPEAEENKGTAKRKEPGAPWMIARRRARGQLSDWLEKKMSNNNLNVSHSTWERGWSKAVIQTTEVHKNNPL